MDRVIVICPQGTMLVSYTNPADDIPGQDWHVLDEGPLLRNIENPVPARPITHRGRRSGRAHVQPRCAHVLAK